MLRQIVHNSYAWLVIACVLISPARSETNPIRVLFLGDQGPHRPADRAAQLIPVLAERGIEVVYTEDARELRPDNLAEFDGLLVYANIDQIEPDQEAALLDFVAGGKGFIPVHCASFCFRNSDRYVELVGAQFQRHGTGVFRPRVAEADHPVMRGFGGFESWDETYVHTRHNERDRTVLEYRADDQGSEPWTWVRTHGDGRVFYTAWGHDARTWGHPGFQNLLERGIRWAVKDDPATVPAFVDAASFPVPKMTPARTDVKPFEYVDAEVPFYPPSERWGTIGEPITKMQKPLPAEESLQHMVVPEGFEVRLFAADPDLRKPICMAWDARGRLWCGETIDYPNELQPEGKGRDQIKICEDTDGDGRADRFTVFADKLSIPTSIAFHRGGVIVQDGSQTWFMKDTDGDDVADERSLLFDGWNMRDTHGGVSNFQYGLDNWIWAMQGYNQSRPTVQGQPGQSFRMGFFRFAPDGSAIEFLRSTDNNTWGLGISEEGIIFGSTANRNPSVYLPVPNRYYERVRGWSASQLGTIADTYLFSAVTDKVRQVDQHGGYTAGAGHALYTARTYPREYWNRTAFVCGPTGHLVGAFVLTPQGADFQSTSPFNLVASDDEWSAPIMAEVGPDGNVWVLDWYNFIVQHNPTPAGYETGRGNAYETDLRDKRHGRIYRIVYRGQSAAESPTVRASHPSLDSPEQLVATLRHDNMLWRKHAQRLLVERGELDVVPQLIELVRDESIDAIGLNAGAIHALWTLHGLGAIDRSDDARAAVLAALAHPSPGVRRNALAVMPRDEASTDAILEARLNEDANAQVRLACYLALADAPSSETAGAAIAKAFSSSPNLNDRWLADAMTSAAAVHSEPFLLALASAEQVPDAALPRLAIVAEHVARSRESGDVSKLVFALNRMQPRAAAAIIEGLARGWPREHEVDLSDEGDARLEELVARLAPAEQGQLIRLAAAWGSRALEKHAAEISKSLLSILTDEGASQSERVAAAQQLIAFRNAEDEAVRDVLRTVTPRTAPDIASGVIESLTASTAPNTASILLEESSGFTPSMKAAAIRVLLARPRSTLTLLDALSEGAIQLSELSLDQRQGLAAHPDRQVARRARQLLSRGGGLPNPDRQNVLDELMPLTRLTGNAQLGKEVFKKQCAKCHTHGGEGTKIGPDLTGMAVHPKHELLTQIIDPSRSVEGNYRVYSLITSEGRVLNGLLASETKTTIELFDAEGKKHVVLREDLEELVASPKSLMPEGFEKQVPAEDLTNLLEFLTQRGRFVPIPLDKYATIVSTQGMFFDKAGTAERLIFPDWSPKVFNEVPFYLVDPQGDRVPNVIMLHGPRGNFAPRMPRSVTLPCNAPAKALHFLSGVSGWGYPAIRDDSVSMIVRLQYADGQVEDHPLKNGVHFADYIRRVDVPESELAFMLRGQQIRYFAVHPGRSEPISTIELVKGPDESAPIVMAVTIESP